jgi:hypothetical protein
MRCYRLLWLIVIFVLPAACRPYADNQVVGAQGAQLPTATQNVPTTSTAVSTVSTAVPHDPPDTCPITRPQQPPFTAPPPNSPNAPWSGEFWYGSEALWTAVPTNGVWSGLPHNPEGYTQKVFWWRKGYSWRGEPQPALTVTGRRLDASAPPLNVSSATNAFAEDIQSAMLVGVDFPTLGCWEIKGRYAGTELAFVVWVAP